MLSRERDPVHAYTRLDEDVAVTVEASEGVVDLIQGVFIYDVSPDKVTELQESRQSSHHLWRNMTLNGQKIDLECNIRTTSMGTTSVRA